ncbi:MAG TPA: hypothetical protein PLP83_01875 [Candidatus Aminicenantes bacterium]|nr:hypothetical protein [Candidatus Aminicenantes bacterium]
MAKLSRAGLAFPAGAATTGLAGVLIAFLMFPAKPVEAQMKIPKDKIKIPIKAPRVPDLDKMLQEEPPISTALGDVAYDIPFLDDYDPDQGAFMTFLPVTPRAGFPLLPGLWEGQFQSYCLRAGTCAPGAGDGYAHAPLKGKQADIVANVLKSSVFHPEIDQEDVQLLLWAIISRSKLSDCGKDMQRVAKALMTTKEYDRLNGGALGKIPEPVLNAAMQKLPSQAREVFQAEARLREMLAGAVPAPYHEVERAALRVGEILAPPDSRVIPGGRWSYEPDGYFIRYFPSSYATTRIQIQVPESFTIETDDDGLMTSISDRQGLRIEIVYDADIEPLLFAGDGNVAGFAFKELILTGIGSDGRADTRRIKDAGWVLAGVPAGGGKPAGSAGPRFSDASDRYAFALSHRDEVLGLKDGLAKADPKLRGSPDAAAWSLIYVGNHCQAIRLAVRAASGAPGSGSVERPPALTGLPYRAWMKGLALLAAGELGSEEAGEAAAVADGASKGTPEHDTAAVRNGPFFAFQAADGPCSDAENGSFSNGAEKALSGRQKRTQARELPKFNWVKKPAKKWERDARPKKWKPHQLPEFVPGEKVAQPGNTAKQRLGLSGTKTGSGNGREAAENTRKAMKWFSSGTSAASSGAGQLLKAGTPYGIPKAVAGYSIGWTVGVWGDVIDATSMDPPRSDYTVLARPDPGAFTPLRAGDGVTGARADAFNAFMTAAIDLTAKMRAARFSVERHSGAMSAGADEWAGRQLENAIRYERESGLAMLAVADSLEALTRLAVSERVPDIQLTTQLMESYRDSLGRAGFGAEELEVCGSLNLTAEEIEEMKHGILDPGPMEGPDSFYQSALELARALRGFSRLWLSLPVSGGPPQGSIR